MDYINSLSFGEILNRERNKRNMSFTELSKLIAQDNNETYRISPSYLSRLENNDYDNPSIKNVLILTEKLSIDIAEVVKSFGFGNLIASDEEFETINIEDLIRSANITIPLDKSAKSDSEKPPYLDNMEKEILIEIINIIFNMKTCDGEEILFEHSKITSALEKFRKNGINKLRDKDIKNDIVKSLDIGYEIIFTEKAREQIYRSQFVEVNDIKMIIHDKKDELLYLEGLTDLKYSQGPALIHLYKQQDVIEVIGITEYEF